MPTLRRICPPLVGARIAVALSGRAQMLPFLLLIACSVRQEPAVGPEPVPPRLLASSDTELRSGNGSDSVAIAFGLTPLRQIDLPTGDAEIRLWTGSGIGAPNRMLRMIRSSGQVTGFVAWHWPVANLTQTRNRPWVPGDSVLRYNYRGRCAEFRRQGNAEGCIALLSHEPPWQMIWDSLARLGAWTQPDQSELPGDGILVSDGWSMTLELRDGESYRSFAYSNPDAHPHPMQQRAAQIGQVGGEAWAAASLPPSQLRSYRGRLDVPYRQLQIFIPCGSDQKWGVQPDIGQLVRDSDDVDSTIVRSWYVELRAMPVTPGLLEMWRSAFEEVLSVHGVVVAKPWTADACDTVEQ